MKKHNLLSLTIALLITSVLSACDRSKKAHAMKQPAATVTSAVKESSLATVTLTTQAEQRLGVRTAFAEAQVIQRFMTVGATTSLPPGATITVNSPVAGRVTQKLTQDDYAVKQSTVLFDVFPLLQHEHFVVKPIERIQINETIALTESSLAELETQLKAANITLTRAEQLKKAEVGSDRMLQDAKAQVALLKAKKQTALTRLKTLRTGQNALPALHSSRAIAVRAPVSGYLSMKHVSDNQFVPAGAPLFSIVNTSTLWVTAPVYVGDRTLIDRTKPVWIGSSEQSKTMDVAVPIAGVPTANAMTNTVDLVFKFDNTDLKFNPNQRVWLRLPLKEKTKYLTVPYSAILYDIHGSAWVYQKLRANTYVRRRIEIEFKHESFAVIRRGISAGMEVVEAGAAEIFGTEFWYR